MTKKLLVPIKGMHCSACEILTEEKLAAVPGVSSAKSDHACGLATIEYNGAEPSLVQLKQAVKEAGYEYGDDKELSSDEKTNNYYEFAQALIIFLVLYFILKITGLTELVNMKTDSVMGPSIVLLIGLVAGFSSCMALVGGLVLSVTARYAQAHKDLKARERFVPHVYFNIGRVLGYAVLGGLLGATGSAVHLSTGLSGWLIVIIALVMAGLGLKLIGLFPVFNRFELALPKSVLGWFGVRERSEERYSTKKTMLLGALTFFVPCGFTQAMQLYALGSGSAMTGAVTMGLFALGTAPGLLGLGGLVSIVKGKWSSVFFRLAGIAVLAFALFNLRNGWNLVGASGFALSSGSGVQVEESANKEEQIIKMVQTSRGYSPKNFTVEAGRPVKWVIDSQNANSCAASIVAPKIKVNMQLKAGENVIRFTPTETGAINFTCSMGMYRGVINVVEKGVGKESSQSVVPAANAANLSEDSNGVASASSCGASCGSTGKACGGASEAKGCNGSCGCGAKRAVATQATTVGKAETLDTAVSTQAQAAVKVFKTTYTLDKDIVPSEFRTKVGQATRIEVLVKEAGRGCMKDIMIQGLAETPQYLAEGETIKLEFTPEAPGRYLITCAMNIPRGVVVVE